MQTKINSAVKHLLKNKSVKKWSGKIESQVFKLWTSSPIISVEIIVHFS